MKILSSLAGKALAGIFAVFGASALTFVFLRVVPGDPVRLIVGPFASDSAYELVRQELGLDLPLPVQYWRFVQAFAGGDWGHSYSTGSPVRELFSRQFTASLELGIWAFTLAVTGAVLLSYLATRFPRGLVRRGIDTISIIGLGTPEFWLALLGLIVFSATLGVLPGPEGRLSAGTEPPPHLTGLFTVDSLIAGRADVFADAVLHLLLPAAVLSAVPLAYLTRLLTANLRTVTGQPYVTVFRTFGSSRSGALLRVALPNAAAPTIAASGMLLGNVITGGVLIEAIFAWPGIGAQISKAIQEQDFAVVQSFVILTATIYVVVNLFADTASVVVDPRARRPR